MMGNEMSSLQIEGNEEGEKARNTKEEKNLSATEPESGRQKEWLKRKAWGIEFFPNWKYPSWF